MGLNTQQPFGKKIQKKLQVQNFWLTLHCESKNKTPFLSITSPSINQFSSFFTARLGSKFATNSCLDIPPRLKHVATLPCEI